MNKQEFLNQLEYLLQDIPEDEKRDAIDYYGDYLDEAGPEHEAEVLAEFGSPERIASIIRTDLLDVMSEGGEFTENGYEDRRFERTSLPSVRREAGRDGKTGGSGSPYSKGSYARRRQEENSRKKENKWPKYLLIAMIVLIASPFVFAALMGVFGGSVGIVAVLFALILVLAALTLSALVGGVGLIAYGLTQIAADFWFGLLNVGLGLAFTGVGLLLFVCAILFYGRFIPWAVRGIIQIVRNIGNRNSGRKPGQDSGRQPGQDSGWQSDGTEDIKEEREA